MRALFVPLLACSRRLILAAGVLVVSLGAGASEAGWTSPLISAEALRQQRASAPELLLLDASPTPLHRAGHIPGAISADAMSLMAREFTPTEVAAAARRWGYSPGTKLVIYDQGGTYFAPRLFHELYRAGVPAASMALLDGGLARWRATGGAVSQEDSPAPVPGRFEAAPPADRVRVSMPEFLSATADASSQVTLDALDESYYYGATKFFNKGGHVPLSVSWPAEAFFNADKTFKSPEEIRRTGRHLGLGPERTIHSHCGGGGAAAVPFFALKFLAGYPQVTLFAGSQMAWLRDGRELPFWTYGAPMLLRDSAWVAGWNDRMLRLFGASRLNLLDVRPAEAYAQGHLPFSASLPLEAILASAGGPAARAERFRQAGMDPRHETVVIADGGISERGSQALVALRQAGYATVSLLADSVDDWALKGFELSREATRVGVPATPAGASLPLPREVATPRAAEPGDDQLPVVAVALGAPSSRTSSGGRVVPLPIADVLLADGRPRPAAELWTRLDKAGVSRFARVEWADSGPGPRAQAYVLLSLMGYPNLALPAIPAP